MSEDSMPHDPSPLDDAERRDLAEKVGSGSATTPPGDLTSPTGQTPPGVDPNSQSSQERSGYWPASWREGDEPYRHYWRALYPKAANPDSGAFWLAKLKTADMCMGLFGARQRARHEWIASGPRRGRQEAHETAVVTYHASPVRSQTVRVCLSCLWVSADLDAEHR